MTKLFGTDGIRAKAGTAPLDPPTVCRVGAALVRVLPVTGAAPRILIGGDTRESCSWIAAELTRGLTAEGATAVSVGVTPTPGVAYLTRSEGFDAGIVISASHNPYEDNGIKIFSGRGEKLDEAFERRIEAMVADTTWRVDNAAAASLEHRPALRDHYTAHLMKVVSGAGRLAGSRLVVDCANGATTTVAPELFRRLGFNVIVIGDEPNGRNINLNCGSTHLELLQKTVLETSARLGVAFDGDGDRALFVDHRGQAIDGDAVLLLAGIQLQKENRLPGNAIVATVMSNIGLELALKERNIELLRAPVGDKYVMEQMLARGIALGGEQSGHIIFADHLFTGDGIATALQVLRIIDVTGRELDDLAGALVAYPQVLVNVRVRERADYMGIPAIADSIKRVEERVDGQGRLLIRYSGTEPLLRIMIEGRNDGEIRQWANDIAEAVKGALGDEW
ncbi:MAG TPA: phosphoglucosamine mutase [Vicinamibacterales bacterium]|nr:phosphoglucosamine mutase [Vicinamibacterales bacterium]